jgi:uncharacterized protein (DUF433 family)
MIEIVSSHPNVMHGTACFAGTRVAVQTLFDHLEEGYTIPQFLDAFPTVTAEQVRGLLEMLRKDVERKVVTSSA